MALVVALVLGAAAPPPTAADEHMKFVQRGRAEAEQLWRRGFTLGDEALDAKLQALLDTLVAGATAPPGVTLRVRVMRSPENNAFALPDGSIFVFAGLLSQLTTRDQLAFILRHEAEHALGDHALRQVRSANSTLGVLSVLSMVSSIAVGNSLVDALIQQGLGLTASYAVNGYGRELEREADLAAAARLEPAGFNGCGAPQSLGVLLRQEKQPGRVENVFWGNHPMLEDRIRYVSARAQAKDCTFDSTLVSEDYAPIKWPMLKLSASLWVAEREPIRAARTAQLYLATFADDADVHTTLGDAFALEAMRDTTKASSARSPSFKAAAPGLQDTLALAIAAYQQALELGGNDFRPPLRGLALVAERARDTTACVGYLERYLAGDAPVKDRRMLRNKLEAIQSRIAVRTPAASDTTASDTTATPAAGKGSEHKED